MSSRSQDRRLEPYPVRTVVEYDIAVESSTADEIDAFAFFVRRPAIDIMRTGALHSYAYSYSKSPVMNSTRTRESAAVIQHMHVQHNSSRMPYADDIDPIYTVSELLAHIYDLCLQDHLDQALDAWIGYNEPTLVARTWCLKGSCSGAAGDFAVAASSFKRAQQLAEQAGDVQLALCVMLNRAIAEVRLGDPTAAAACSRRAFVKAEAEHDPEMMLVAHCVRCVKQITPPPPEVVAGDNPLPPPM